jgi:HK97 family phage major capsid protein
MNVQTPKYDPLVETITALLISKMSGVPAARVAIERYGDTAAVRTLLASTGSGAGAAGDIVPIELYAQGVIDALRARTVVRKNTPSDNIFSMEHGNLTIGRANTVVSVAWQGESQQSATPSSPTWGAVSLVAKKAVASIIVSNDLLRFEAPGLERVVRDQLLRAYGTAEDAAFLTSPGSQFTPQGIRWQAATVNSSNSSYTATTVLSEIQGLVAALETSNVPVDNAVFYTSPKIREYLLTLVAAGSGNLLFSSVAEGRLLGRPIEVSTAITTTLGGSSNESELYLVDMESVLIGQSYLDVTIHNASTFHDANGNLQSVYDQDCSGLRLVGGVDIGIRHQQAAAVLTNINWSN